MKDVNDGMKKILIAPPLEGERLQLFAERVKEKCAGFDCEFMMNTQGGVTVEEIAEANAIIGSVSPGKLAAAKKLELLQLTSAGADAHSAPGVVDESVLLCNCAGAYGTSVSEWMLAVTFSLIRHLDGYMKNQAAKKWESLGRVISIEDSTVLVLGLGDIGGRYAKAVKAMGAHVIGIRRTEKAKPEYLDEQYTIESLPSVVGRADIIAMVLPGGRQTEHLFDEKLFALCKNGAYIINAGRGNAIDPAALKNALKSGRIAGAGLDVTEPEPLPADDELWTMDNVVITPHIAGGFFLEKTFDNVAEIASNNIAHWLKGEPADHVVNRKTGY